MLEEETSPKTKKCVMFSPVLKTEPDNRKVSILAGSEKRLLQSKTLNSSHILFSMLLLICRILPDAVLPLLRLDLLDRLGEGGGLHPGSD